MKNNSYAHLLWDIGHPFCCSDVGLPWQACHVAKQSWEEGRFAWTDSSNHSHQTALINAQVQVVKVGGSIHCSWPVKTSGFIKLSRQATLCKYPYPMLIVGNSDFSLKGKTHDITTLPWEWRMWQLDWISCVCPWSYWVGVQLFSHQESGNK